MPSDTPKLALARLEAKGVVLRSGAFVVGRRIWTVLQVK
jgi:hypothetical protein